MPFGTRAPRRSKRFGSRRKSTTSCSSSFASSRPATCSQVTDEDEPGVISVGRTRGISLTVRQRSSTTTSMSPKNMTGSHVRAKLCTSEPKLASIGVVIGATRLRLEPLEQLVDGGGLDPPIPPGREAARRPLLVEPAGRVLGEDDAPAPLEEPAHGRVVANVRR